MMRKKNNRNLLRTTGLVYYCGILSLTTATAAAGSTGRWAAFSLLPRAPAARSPCCSGALHVGRLRGGGASATSAATATSGTTTTTAFVVVGRGGNRYRQQQQRSCRPFSSPIRGNNNNVDNVVPPKLSAAFMTTTQPYDENPAAAPPVMEAVVTVTGSSDAVVSSAPSVLAAAAAVTEEWLAASAAAAGAAGATEEATATTTTASTIPSPTTNGRSLRHVLGLDEGVGDGNSWAVSKSFDVPSTTAAATIATADYSNGGLWLALSSPSPAPSVASDAATTTTTTIPFVPDGSTPSLAAAGGGGYAVFDAIPAVVPSSSSSSSLASSSSSSWTTPSSSPVAAAFNNNDGGRPPKVVGHRGAMYDALENTREGFLRCADLGCHAVELDVFLVKDGTLVVFHGGGTDQNPGDLSEYILDRDGVSILDLETYQDCLELKFDPSFAEFPCPAAQIVSGRIPTLEQVLLDLKGTGIDVKIELKGPGTVVPVLELVERLDMVDRCQYSSFDHSMLAELRRMRPQVDESTGKYVYKTGALFDDVPDDYLERALMVGASEIHLRYDTTTKSRVQQIRNAGLTSMAWFRGPRGMASDLAEKYHDVGFEENVDCYRALIETGVDEVCVNRPDILISMLFEYRQQDAAANVLMQ